jgi:hypothetical protein
MAQKNSRDLLIIVGNLLNQGQELSYP